MPIGMGAAMLISGVAAAGGTAATGIYSAHKQAGSARQATAATTSSNNRAAELEAQSARESLAFLKSQEAARQAEHTRTEALNLDQYNQQGARLAPYRTLGSSAVDQLLPRMQGGTGRSLLPPPTQRRTLG